MLELADDVRFRAGPPAEDKRPATRTCLWRTAGELGAEQHALFEQEEFGKADQCLVVVPAGPAAHFVLSHAQFAFRILEAALDPIALGLHVGHSLPRGLCIAIRQGVFECTVSVLPYEQPAGADAGGLTVPLPNPGGPHPGVKPALG